jgi:L-asparaginase
MDPILIVTTGGTIDKVYFDASSEFEVGESVIQTLLAQAQVRGPHEVISLLRKDSLDMTADDRALIRQTIADRDETRVIVTHGTDTMTESARVLQNLPDKTIVLTGSLAPARFAQSDAVFNVGMAFGAVQSLSQGVYIVMNGQVFDADAVTKDLTRNQFVRT